MKSILGISLVMILFACQSGNEPVFTTETVIEPKEITSGEYQKVGEQLFQDKQGNLYFRTIDRSAINDQGEVLARYNKQMYYDSVIGKDTTLVTIDLKGIVDPKSFKQTGEEGLEIYYKDKKHTYFHLEMADGGTLHFVK